MNNNAKKINNQASKEHLKRLRQAQSKNSLENKIKTKTIETKPIKSGQSITYNSSINNQSQNSKVRRTVNTVSNAKDLNNSKEKHITKTNSLKPSALKKKEKNQTSENNDINEYKNKEKIKNLNRQLKSLKTKLDDKEKENDQLKQVKRKAYY